MSNTANSILQKLLNKYGKINYFPVRDITVSDIEECWTKNITDGLKQMDTFIRKYPRAYTILQCSEKDHFFGTGKICCHCGFNKMQNGVSQENLIAIIVNFEKQIKSVLLELLELKTITEADHKIWLNLINKISQLTNHIFKAQLNFPSLQINPKKTKNSIYCLNIKDARFDFIFCAFNNGILLDVHISELKFSIKPKTIDEIALGKCVASNNIDVAKKNTDIYRKKSYIFVCNGIFTYYDIEKMFSDNLDIKYSDVRVSLISKKNMINIQTINNKITFTFDKQDLKINTFKF